MSANIVTTLPLGPFDPERTELLLRVVEGLEPSTLQWLSGFAAGVAHERVTRGASAGVVVATPSARQEPAARLTIVYGSQTGNGKRIAERLARAAESAGLATRVYASGSYPLKDLVRERMFVVVVSTQGDGDPPDDARGFLEFLQSKRAPMLDQLSYSVLALGDSSYPKFCETGRQVDDRLAALDAKRLLDRVDCDVDYDTLANAWLDRVVNGARDTLGGSAQSATVTRLRTAPVEPQFSREQPFAAEVIANHSLTGRGATRKSGTSRSASRVRVSRMRRAMRSACGTRIRQSSCAKCCKRCASTASRPSSSTVPRSRCMNGSRQGVNSRA